MQSVLLFYWRLLFERQSLSDFENENILELAKNDE